MSPELVSKTRCVNHGVLNKLEILLQGMSILILKYFILIHLDL